MRLFACAWDSRLQEEASFQSHGDPPCMGHLLGGPWDAGALSNENLKGKASQHGEDTIAFLSI